MSRIQANPTPESETDRPKPYQPSDAGKFVAIGAIVVAIAFGAFGTWAATAPLDSAAVAPGTVMVESNRKLVQHPDGGVVKRIAVKEGDMVRRDDVLLELDTTESRARFDAVRQNLMAALLRKARLQAERTGAEEMQLPDELQNPANAEHAREIEAALAAERAQFAERRRSLDGKVAIHREKITQLKDRIAGVQAEKESAEQQMQIMRNELVGLRELHEKGYYPRTNILKMERQLAQLGGKSGSAEATIAEARTQIGEARLQIEQVRQQFSEQVSNDLTEVRNKIAELRQRFVMAAHKLSVSKVRAPQDGVVQNLNVHTVGGVIQPGKEIMEIIPTDDRLVLQVEVKPTDIDVVAEGQDAEVRLTAFSGRTTPSLIGRVTRLSADRITRAQGQGMPPRSFYQARVEIPPQELDKLDDQKLQAGMPADVLIKTGEQTLLAYLARPITDAMSTGLIEQ
ncbi:HlyD family type I secretion periplasmic adaptor subunit [Rhodovibrio salinarum]|uniref:HlyD family type I secretion periplasmic adaptor subunit n=1 Tax=Rhodovibrio salinarum TaxID=1087 RepID=UPI0004B13090|nr:HlyD family type I secretion periplasmic adaptor subunit [Rhodovibrio salinarum]